MAYIEKWICRAEQTAKHCSDTTFVKAGNQKQKECSGTYSNTFTVMFQTKQPGPNYLAQILYCTVHFLTCLWCTSGD